MSSCRGDGSWLLSDRSEDCEWWMVEKLIEIYNCCFGEFLLDSCWAFPKSLRKGRLQYVFFCVPTKSKLKIQDAADSSETVLETLREFGNSV